MLLGSWAQSGSCGEEGENSQVFGSPGFKITLFFYFSPAGFPMGYAAAAPAYSPNMYPGANPTFQAGMQAHMCWVAEVFC